ncbi:PAS domain-containing protein, partial [Streptomyces carpinensis]
MTDRSGSPDEPGARQQAHVVIDRRGRVVEWDSQAEALLGYPGEEALGRSAADLLGALAAGVSAAAGDGPAVVLRRRDG